MAFIPVHDGKALSHIRRPYVGYALILINVVVFFFVQAGTFDDADQASMISFGLIPAVFNHVAELPPEFISLPDQLTLVTYAFIHGDFWHLVGNMVFLYVFADNVEDAFGHVRFGFFYLLCAIGGGYAYVLAEPASEAPVVGASGAIAGIVAAYFLLHPFQKVWVLAFGRIPLRLGAFWVLGFWILFQVYAVFTAGPDDQVAWVTHIGGLLTGAVLVLIFRRRGVRLFDRGDPPLPVQAPFAKVDDGNPGP